MITFFNTGTTLAIFRLSGTLPEENYKLIIRKRGCKIDDAICFKIEVAMLSGPGDLYFFMFLIILTNSGILTGSQNILLDTDWQYC